MGCGQSSKASQDQQPPKPPATGTDSTPGGSSSSSAPATGSASASAAAEQQPKGSDTGPGSGGSERLVVNAAATLLAAQAAGLALTAAEALPFAGPLIRSMQRVHTVFEIHEDIQQELEHLAKRQQCSAAAPQSQSAPQAAQQRSHTHSSLQVPGTPCYCCRSAIEELISFGDNEYGQRDLPQGLRAAGWTSGASTQRLKPSVEVLQLAAWDHHTLYLVKEEGKERTAVHAAGNNDFKQCEVPPALGRGPAVKAVAAGGCHSLALTVAGKVIGWGWDYEGRIDVQAFEKVQLIAAGDEFSAVITEEGKLYVVGKCHYADLREGLQLSGIPIAMDAGKWHIIVLYTDGRAEVFITDFLFRDEKEGVFKVPPSINGQIEAIECGQEHTVYLVEGGGVVAAGYNRAKQCDIQLHSSEKAIAVAAHAEHNLVLMKDGTLRAFGYKARHNDCGQFTVPEF